MNKYIYTSIIGVMSLLIGAGCSKNDDSSGEKMESAHGSPAESAEIVYKAAEGWIQETPRGSMRLDQYRLPGQDGAKDAELAVFVFPGGGGNVQANIDRWIGQFKQPDGSSSTDFTEIGNTNSHDLPVTLVYVTGTYLSGAMGGAMSGSSKEMPGFAMLAAIVETEKDPWFFKAVGPQPTIDYWRPAFESFTQTFKLK